MKRTPSFKPFARHAIPFCTKITLQRTPRGYPNDVHTASANMDGGARRKIRTRYVEIHYTIHRGDHQLRQRGALQDPHGTFNTKATRKATRSPKLVFHERNTVSSKSARSIDPNRSTTLKSQRLPLPPVENIPTRMSKGVNVKSSR